MKTVRPLWLHGDAVCFLWALANGEAEAAYRESIATIACSVASLGWGVDVVVGDSGVVEGDGASLQGDHWYPCDSAASGGLRVPVAGTLTELSVRHEAFTRRISVDGFTAPPPLSRYQLVEYRRATDLPSRAFVAFSFVKLDARGFRAFDAVRKGLTVAGMVRHATKSSARSSAWDDDEIARVVLGHGEPRNARHAPSGKRRFAYLPLPSIEPRGDGKRVVGSIRRVVLASIGDGMDAEIGWAKQALAGQELIDERTNEPVALLSLLSPGDNVVKQYTTQASIWSTVTPVVLPGYDDPGHLRRKATREGVTAGEQRRLLDRLANRVDGLVRKALVHSGLSKIVADNAVVEWRKVGFLAGVDRADRYGVPDHLKRFARYHARIQFRDAHGTPVDVPGPLCIGAGRFYGLGLFVAEADQ